MVVDVPEVQEVVFFFSFFFLKLEEVLPFKKKRFLLLCFGIET